VALRPKSFLASVAACAFAAMTPRMAASQHITVDGHFSPAQTLIGPNYSIAANLGKQVGSNLFHSFGQFGLSTGESAAFSGPATISNVISRVTGGTQSDINGKLQSNITGANLYLINPSGIVFGPNATVNVSGSFHASTADYLKMSDGAKFQATNPGGSTLSAAPPAAFGFLTARPSAITVNGSTLGPVPGTLGVVAGPVSITASSSTATAGAVLSAPAGTVHVTSVGGTGEVPIDPRNTAALTVTSFGPVDIKGGSKLDVGNPGGLGAGGSVFIHAGALTIDASEISADNYGSGPGGVLALRGENQVALNGASVHAAALGSGSGAGVVVSTAASGSISADASTVLTSSTGPGDAGLLAVSTGQLTLTNGAQLASVVQGTGNAGPIAVSADSLLVDGTANPGTLTGIGSVTAGPGRAADVAVAAGGLTILANGEIVSITTGSGNAGNVSVSALGAASIDGSSAIFQTGILSQANPGSSGNAGSVQVNAGSASLVNAGQISARRLVSARAATSTSKLAGNSR
jgi:filamentous hemagglutinin family protein